MDTTNNASATIDDNTNSQNETSIDTKNQVLEEDSNIAQSKEELDGNKDDEDSQKPLSLEEKAELDSRSIFVGNLHPSATLDEVQHHFQSCGIINRVTILCDKYTGRSKGHAYVEFSDPSQIQYALSLNGSIMKGRELKVTAKRTNFPGYARARAVGSNSSRAFRAGRSRGFGYRTRGYRGGSRSRGRRSFKTPY